MLTASILGVTGYAGIELLRLLIQHPDVKINSLFSHSQAGKKLTDIYPQFKGIKEFSLFNFSTDLVKQDDLVFTALPHGISQPIVADIIKSGPKVIDLSGDFRYKDITRYESWYKQKHHFPQLAKQAVYGLVEFNRELIKEADIIANPGCYATASLLSLGPLVIEDLIDINSIIIDAKSGTSGAGKSLKEELIFSEVDENIKAYGVTTHRHTSEIEAVLEELSLQGNQIQLSFTPHLIPMKRGILTTTYSQLKQELTETEVIHLFHQYYPETGFVQVLTNRLPETKYVLGTNYCQLGLKIDQRTHRLIVITVIDNLGKGAAGQAIQNMNVLFKLPEMAGLTSTAVFP